MINKVYKMSFFSSFLLLILGILLFTNAELFIKSFSIIIGCILVTVGLLPVIDYFKNKKTEFLSSMGLIAGVFGIVFGLIFLLNSDMLVILLPIFIGVWMIINGINKIQISYEIRDKKESTWIITFIFSILIILGGLYLIINPISGVNLVAKTIGIIIIIYSLFDVIDCIIIRIKLGYFFKDNSSKIDKSKVIDEQ